MSVLLYINLLDGDPIKRYEIDDIVDVQLDKPVTVPPAHPFAIIRVTGDIEKKDVMRFIEPDVDLTDPDNPVQLRRRKRKINRPNIPPPFNSQLEQSRYVEVPYGIARAFIFNKVTGNHDNEE